MLKGGTPQAGRTPVRAGADAGLASSRRRRLSIFTATVPIARRSMSFSLRFKYADLVGLDWPGKHHQFARMLWRLFAATEPPFPGGRAGDCGGGRLRPSK